MKTSVTYSVVSRKNPRDPKAEPLFYAQARARGVADTSTLSDRIEVMCSMTRSDVVGVLSALETVIKECLSNGEIVRLGDLGSLQLSLSSKGSPSKDMFVSSLINNSRILFRPGERLRAMQKTLRFERVEPLPKNDKKKEDDSSATEDPDSAGTDEESEVMP